MRTILLLWALLLLALPGQARAQGPANPGDTPAERWVWERLTSFPPQPADLGTFCGEAQPSTPVPDDARWAEECRQLSAGFLLKLLVRAPWKDALPYTGVRILHARVNGPLDLTAAKPGGEVQLAQSLFTADVRLDRAAPGAQLDFNGSGFVRGLSAEGMVLGANLVLRGARFGGPLVLAGARIDGNIDLTGATLEQGLNANGLRAGAGLWLRNGAVVRGGPVQLRGGARVADTLDLDGVSVERGVIADTITVGGALLIGNGGVRGGPAAELSGPLVLSGARVEGDIRLDGGRFAGGILAPGLRGGASLFMRNGVVVAGPIPFTLRRAEIAGNLEVAGATFERGIDAESLRVGTSFFLREGSVVRGGPLILRVARVGGLLDMTGATIEQGMNAESIEVTASLLLRDGATLRCQGEDCLGLELARASIGGILDFREAKIEARISAARLRLGSTLSFIGATVTQPPVVQDGEVNGSVFLQRAALAGLDLSGTSIRGDLVLARERDRPPVWAEGARLVLRNTKAGAIQDFENATLHSWPAHIDLQGFAYERLGGTSGAEDEMLRRPAIWFTDWLARDPRYTRQPYQQLASVLRTAGETETADRVLYAGRDRELREAIAAENWRGAAVLGLLWATIGYGIGLGYFRVLVWVAAITVLGATLLFAWSRPARERGFGFCFGVSLNRLLPLVELNAEYIDFLRDPERHRMSRGHMAYFAFHSVVGYVLGAFVAAGMGGLTQAQ